MKQGLQWHSTSVHPGRLVAGICKQPGVSMSLAVAPHFLTGHGLSSVGSGGWSLKGVIAETPKIGSAKAGPARAEMSGDTIKGCGD